METYFKNRALMIKAALECQKVDVFLKSNIEPKASFYRKKELALERYYKYGGQRELINCYKKEDLNEEKLQTRENR